MKTMFFANVLFLFSAYSISAQTVHFPVNQPHAISKFEQNQAYLDGSADVVLMSAYRPKEVASDFYPDFYGMGYFYLETGELQKAKEAFATFLTLAADEPIAYYGMGDYYLTVQDYAKAAEYYKRAAAMGLPDAREKAAAAEDEALLKEIEEQKGGWE